MTRTFQVDCYGWFSYDDPNPRTMTEPEVVAHVLRCRNGHSILHDGEPCFVVKPS